VSLETRGVVTTCNIGLEKGGEVRKTICGGKIVGQLVCKIQFYCEVKCNCSIVQDKSLQKEIADDLGTSEMAHICRGNMQEQI